MPRWQRQGGPNDQTLGWSYPQPVGDTAFVGMDLKTRDPAGLLTGWYQEGYNARIENGGLATRKGSLAPGSYNYIQYGTIYGVGVYSDPNGQEYLAIAVSAGVWFTYDGGNAVMVPMASSINYPVEFSQAFQNFYMWRGPTMTPLVWQGDWSIYWQELNDPGALATIYTGTWNWNSATYQWNWITTATPANGQFATNTGTWVSTTATVSVAKVTSSGTNVATELLGQGVGDVLTVQDSTNFANWAEWNITAAPTDHTTYVTYPVSWRAGSGTTAAANALLNVSFSSDGQIATGTNDWTSLNTVVDVTKKTADGLDASSELILPQVGDTIRMQVASNSAVWVQWHIAAVGVDEGEFIQYQVNWNSGSGIAPATGTPLEVTFLATSKADTTRKPMPNAYTAETFANRMLVPHDRDSMAISDIEQDSFQWTVNDFRINAGEADVLVRVFPWVQATVMLFKAHSIFQMANVTGDLSQTTLQKLPGTIGLCGLKAVVAVAGDVLFMDWSGVYKITQVFEGSPQASTLPVSDNIKPLIDSINWTCAAGIRAGTRRERVYFAVPLDNAIRNNVLLVYNMVTTAWESIDTFANPDFRIDDLINLNYIGERRLFAIDRQLGLVLLLEQGRTDLMGQNGTFEEQIDFAVLTRGYAGSGPRNNFPRVGIEVASWNPTFSVEAFVDGCNAKTLVSNRTKDRTKYETFGKPRWNNENLNDDHASSRRRDYSVGLPLMIGYNGVQVERQQESTERFDVDMFGRYCQLRITDTQGTVGIRRIFMEDYEDQREPRSQV